MVPRPDDGDYARAFRQVHLRDFGFLVRKRVIVSFCLNCLFQFTSFFQKNSWNVVLWQLIVFVFDVLLKVVQVFFLYFILLKKKIGFVCERSDTNKRNEPKKKSVDVVEASNVSSIPEPLDVVQCFYDTTGTEADTLEADAIRGGGEWLETPIYR